MQKIPAFRRILMQNINNQNREDILKILNNKIDEKENELSEFLKNNSENKTQILNYFSKVN